MPSIHSQNPTKTDSLLSLISAEKVDTIKARKLNELGQSLRRNSPELAIKYAKEALAILKKSAIEKGTSFSYLIIGTAQMNMGNTADAFENFNIAINNGIAFEEYKIVANAYNNIGIIYIKQGKSTEALEYYIKSLEIREKKGLKESVPASYSNIGNVYYQQQNYDKALSYYQKALSLFEKTNKLGIASTTHNIGDVLNKSGKPDSALFYFKISLELNKEIGDIRGTASAIESIARTYLDRNMTDEAFGYYKSALELYKSSSDSNGIADVMFDLARLELAKGNINAAKKQVQFGIGFAKRYGNNMGLQNNYLLLSQINEKQGLFEEALNNHKFYHAYRDSSLNEESAKRFVEIQLNNEFNKKEEQLKQEQLKKDIQAQEQLKNQKLFTRASLIVGSLILILLVLAAFAYRDKRKSHKIIETQKALVEEKQTAIIDSINYAKKLQEAILPKLETVDAFFPNNFILYLPKDIVAGDFYWALETKDSYYMAVCDCTGHGVPGAFMSLLNIGFLNEAIKEKGISEPNKIFDFVRERLIEGIGNDGQQDGMDGILMRFNKKNNSVTYAAAHNSPILIRDKISKVLPTDKMPVGKWIKMQPFAQFNLVLEKGDILYMFTDGFADQFGGPLGKKYKYKQLEKQLISLANHQPKEQQELFAKAFHDWKGNLEQVDDVLIMGIII